MEKAMQLQSIGVVEHSEKGFQVCVHSQYKAALEELNGFSHVEIVWWAHGLDVPELRQMTVLEKPYKKGPDHMGIFATRSPLRPNPVAITIASVIDVDMNSGCITLAHMDAEAGTPVLDIKPYHGICRVHEYRVPQWCSHWPSWLEEAEHFAWDEEMTHV